MKEVMKSWGLQPQTLEQLLLALEKNAFNLEVLKVCQFSDIKPLINASGGKLGEEILFRSSLEAWQVQFNTPPTIPLNVEVPTNLEAASKSTAVVVGPSEASQSTSPIIPGPSEVSTPPPEKPAKDYVGHTTASKDLLKVIQSSIGGQEICSFYEKHKKLDYKRRNRLSHLIIDSEINKSLNHRITASQFLNLREDVVRIFPTEIDSQWYTPFIPANPEIPHSKAVNARGKLIETYHNHRKDLIQHGIIAPAKKKKKAPMDTPIPDLVVSETLETLQTAEVTQTFAEQQWPETVDDRLQNFTRKYGGIQGYFLKYPVLKQDFGKKLFRLDFEHLFPELSNKLTTTWGRIKKLVIDHAINNCEVPAYQDFLVHNDIDLNVKDPHLATVNAFRLIAFGSSYCKPIKFEKKEWTVKKQDAVDGLLLCVSSSMDMENDLNKKKEQLGEYGLDFQPIPIVVKDEEKVISSHVCINSCYYLCDNPLDAVDLCFKAFHVLNAEYPPQSRLPWLFIQKYLFGLRTVHDSKSSTPLNFARKINLIV